MTLNPRARRTLVGGAVALAGAVAAIGLVRGWERSASPEEIPVEVTILDSAAGVLYVQDLLDPAVLDTSALGRAVDAVRVQVARGTFPGAALVAGRRSDVALSSGIGQVAWDEGGVDPAVTRYDLASLTKVVATTSAVMLLVEDGRMSLDAPVRRYLAQFNGGGKERVTVRHLLTHTSGLPAVGRSGSLAELLRTRLESKPGARVRYSDIGMIVLWAAAERAAKEPLSALLRRRVWDPLGMRATGFQPGEGCSVCAPTRGADSLRGVVHDPIARRLGGIAGNAGLFSTADDLGRFAAMLASGGAIDSVRVFKEKTVRTFLRQQPRSGSRALGWDTRDGAVLHTGYTGTSLWIDPARGTWAVLLTNRTYEPRARRVTGPIKRVREVVHDWITRAAAEENVEALGP